MTGTVGEASLSPRDEQLPDTSPVVYAGFGDRCGPAAGQRRLVLSPRELDCAQLAAAFADNPPADLWTVDLPDEPAPLVIEGSGENDDWFEIQLTELSEGTVGKGSWSAALRDFPDQATMRIEWCDFAALAPMPQGSIPVRGLALEKAVLYQGVEVPLMEGGNAAPADTPILSDRPALVRLFVTPDPKWTNRDVVARLWWGGVAMEETLRIEEASQAEDLETTINFEIPAAHMAENATWSAGLFEVPGCYETDEPALANRWPEVGEASLPIEDGGPAFEIVLVPVRYNADGSGRLPDTSAAQIDRFVTAATTMMPISGIDIKVRAPFDWSRTIAAGGSGWSNILVSILQLRLDDGVDDHVFYYGLFNPKATGKAYCSGGCVLGMGPVPEAGETEYRGAVGVGYSGETAAETFVHEIGHTLGRQHAPCGGVQGADSAYPYSGGRIGSWGYDLETGTLLRPTTHADLMSYCEPAWISDYTYAAMYERLSFIFSHSSPILFVPPQHYRVVIIEPDGRLHTKPHPTTRRLPRGEPLEVLGLDANGQVLATLQGFRHAVPHIEGGWAYVEEPPEAVVAFMLPGLGVVAARH